MTKKESEWELGDLVSLRSGGPTMTISQLKESGVECWWFDDKKMLRKEVFASAMLREGSEPGITVEVIDNFAEAGND